MQSKLDCFPNQFFMNYVVPYLDELVAHITTHLMCLILSLPNIYNTVNGVSQYWSISVEFGTIEDSRCDLIWNTIKT